MAPAAGKLAAVFVVGLLVGAIPVYFFTVGGATGTTATQTGKTVTQTVNQTVTQSSSQSVKQIRIGVITAVNSWPLYVGIQQGILARYGLQPVLTVTPGSGQAIEGLMSNNYDVAIIAPASVLTFAAQTGNYLKFVSASKLDGALDGRVADPPSVVARTGVVINSIKDFQGKIFLTNALGGPNQLVPLYLMQKGGVNTSTVIFKEVSFPNMPQVLASGQADLASCSEPYCSSMIQQGIAYSLDYKLWGSDEFVAALSNPVLTAAWWTTPQRYGQDHDLFARFAQAMNDAIAYTYALPVQSIQILSNFTKTSITILNATAFQSGLFHPYQMNSPEIKPMLQSWVNLINATGYLKGTVNVDRFFGP